MLISRPRTTSTRAEVANVHNYYERLVAEAIIKTDVRALTDPNFLADVSCVSLNHLPPRYIRHDVDMSFFMSPVEREETENKVQKAVDYALVLVKQHEEEQQEVIPDDIIGDAFKSEEEIKQPIVDDAQNVPATHQPTDGQKIDKASQITADTVSDVPKKDVQYVNNDSVHDATIESTEATAPSSQTSPDITD
jgi:competence protein ComFB